MRSTIILACVLSACSAESHSGADAGPVESGVELDGGPDAAAMMSSACGASVPKGTQLCGSEGLVCEYGDDPRSDCRARATCSSGHWITELPNCVPLGTDCPATREVAQGTACTTDGEVCGYDRLGCRCTNCTTGPAVMCGGPLMWQCDVPNTDPQCPSAQPNDGVLCYVDGYQCNYGCDTDTGRVCTGGVWQPFSPFGGCPR